jgi:hypothetical protein
MPRVRRRRAGAPLPVATRVPNAYGGMRTYGASNAAFAMGRVYFDQRDAYDEAAHWFATYSSERRDGPLAREALGREMEALSRAGDHAGAGRAAEQYLRQYPKGPHAPTRTMVPPSARASVPQPRFWASYDWNRGRGSAFRCSESSVR